MTNAQQRIHDILCEEVDKAMDVYIANRHDLFANPDIVRNLEEAQDAYDDFMKSLKK